MSISLQSLYSIYVFDVDDKKFMCFSGDYSKEKPQHRSYAIYSSTENGDLNIVCVIYKEGSNKWRTLEGKLFDSVADLIKYEIEEGNIAVEDYLFEIRG